MNGDYFQIPVGKRQHKLIWNVAILLTLKYSVRANCDGRYETYVMQHSIIEFFKLKQPTRLGSLQSQTF